MAAVYYILGFILFLLEGVEAAYCRKSYDYYTTTFYCRYGCCGTSYSRYCCGYTNIPLYVGLGVGGFFILMIIIAVICACVKSGTKSGRVVHPNRGVFTVRQSGQGPGYPHGYSGSVPQPPPYGAASAQPPAYPLMGYHPPPAPINPPLAGFNPPPANFQGNAPPPPAYTEPTAPQPFTYNSNPM